MNTDDGCVNQLLIELVTVGIALLVAAIVTEALGLWHV